MLGESVRRRQPRRRVRGPKGARSWKLWLPAVLAALVLPFLVGYVIAVYVLFPPRAVAENGIPVPVLVGKSIGEAERALSAAGLGHAEALELPHPTAPVGRVLAQSPLPGQQLPGGAGVRVSVSSGRPRARVPDVAGLTADRAEQLLQRLGFEVVRQEQEGELAAGRALGTDLQPGAEAILPAPIRLLVSTGPPPEPEPEVLPDTTFPPAPW